MKRLWLLLIGMALAVFFWTLMNGLACTVPRESESLCAFNPVATPRVTVAIIALYGVWIGVVCGFRIDKMEL